MYSNIVVTFLAVFARLSFIGFHCMWAHSSTMLWTNFILSTQQWSLTTLVKLDHTSEAWPYLLERLTAPSCIISRSSQFQTALIATSLGCYFLSVCVKACDVLFRSFCVYVCVCLLCVWRHIGDIALSLWRILLVVASKWARLCVCVCACMCVVCVWILTGGKGAWSVVCS